MPIKQGLCLNIGLSLLCCFQLCCAEAVAAETVTAEPAKITLKLTPSYYQSSNGNNALDINLRANSDTQTAWVGNYRDQNGFQQSRFGYEYKFESKWLRPTLSAQLASGGFIGGAINTEIGDVSYAIVGLGRTNLRDYYNLNFDPNDAITLGIGTRALANSEFALLQVRDDRLGSRQRITHLLWRYKTAAAQRISLDAAYKNGLSNDHVYVHGYALSIEYDYQQYFAKLGRDQYANFTASNLTKMALGIRF